MVIQSKSLTAAQLFRQSERSFVRQTCEDTPGSCQKAGWARADLIAIIGNRCFWIIPSSYDPWN